MSILLASVSILLSADGDGASGRQFEPRLHRVPGAQIERSGYRALTRGGRVCFAEDLRQFAAFIRGPMQRQERGSMWTLRARQSWFIVPAKSHALSDALGETESWSELVSERWSQGENVLDCAVLSQADGDKDTSLSDDLGSWEIRWMSRGQLPRVGSVIEVARPIGDGARRLAHIRRRLEAEPDARWIDLGGLVEGWSWVRDGPSLHRASTVEWLAGRGPAALLPSTDDLVVGRATLRQELAQTRTALLDSFGAEAPEDEQGLVLTIGDRRVAVIGLAKASKALSADKRQQRLDTIFQRLTAGGPIHHAILALRDAADAAQFLNDSRFQIIAVPSAPATAITKAEFSLLDRPQAMLREQSPMLIRVPSNSVVSLTLTADHASLDAQLIDERIEADPALATKVNRLRHQLYPELERLLLPPPAGGGYDRSTLLRVVAAAVLPELDCDALLLKKGGADEPMPGSLSRLQVLAQLASPASMVTIDVDGGALAKAVANQPLELISREQPTAGRPLCVLTTDALATRYKKALAARRTLAVPSDQKGRAQTLPRIALPALDRRLQGDPKAGFAALMKPLQPRPRLVLRVDKLRLSTFTNELRAPAERRAPEDSRTSQPSRTSLGGFADLKLEQPMGLVNGSLRWVSSYTRDLFPADEGGEEIDRESLDDLRMTAELMRASGSLRPFVNGVWDTEHTAGDPTAEGERVRQVRGEANLGLAIPKKGLLHEGRIAATGSQDLSQRLAGVEPAEGAALPGLRFALSATAQWRKKVGKLEARLLLDGRAYLPDTEPQPNTLLWAMGEQLELSLPLGGGLRSALVLAHTVWRTHGDAPSNGLGDNQLSIGFSLDFARVMRPIAGLY